MKAAMRAANAESRTRRHTPVARGTFDCEMPCGATLVF